MKKFKVYADRIIEFESIEIEADNREDAKEKYLEMIECGNVHATPDYENIYRHKIYADLID